MINTWARLSLCLLIASASGAAAQPKVIEKAQGIAQKLIKDSADPGKTQFLAYPTVGFSPETSWQFGVSSVLVFSAKQNFDRNRLSEITLFAFYTLRNQFGLWSDHAVYTDNDAWYFFGRHRLQSFPLLYWGIGPQARRADKVTVDGNYLQVRQRVMHKLIPDLFFGAGMDFQRLFKPEFIATQEQIDRLGSLPLGAAGSTSLGLGPSLIYDTRHNYLNVRNGWFIEGSALFYRPGVGSAYNFNSYIIDFRRYLTPFHKNQTLALQAYFQSIPSGQAPFNMLSMLGSEQLMRGYYMGRFRDNSYAAAQAEYRFLPFPFSKRFGGTAFGGVGSVGSQLSEFSPRQWKWAGGVGARYLLFSRKDIFIRFDAAFTPEGPGYYFFMGEAF